MTLMLLFRIYISIQNTIHTHNDLNTLFYDEHVHIFLGGGHKVKNIRVIQLS